MTNAISDPLVRTQKSTGAKSDGEPVITVWLVEDNDSFLNTVARILNQGPALECM